MSEVKTCSKCGETKALAAFSKEKRSRDGLRRVCKVCARANNKAWYEKNKERERANSKAWYEKNKERARVNDKAWREQNRDKKRTINAARRARRRKAEPVWLRDEHKQAISEKYALSVRLAEERGEEYHVDHIWPLKGKGFRGLHVPWNLQVISASENRSKRNKRPVDRNYNERPACKWSKTLHDY